MDELEEQLWENIEQNWTVLWKALRERLPLDEMKRYDDSGNLVSSGCPLVESIISEKAARSRRLFYYLVAADIIEVPEADFKITHEQGRRIIEVTGFSVARFGTAGRENLSRKGS